MKKTAAAIVALLMTAVICYGVEPLSIQQMLQNSPKETAPQGSTRVLTVRDGTIRQMSYSSVHPVATSTTPGAVKPDGTTTTVDGDGTMHAATVYPNPGIPYSLGNGYGVSFNPDSRIPANYVDLPPLPQSVGPLPAGFHFNSYDAATGVLGYSADASAGSSTDYNAVHTSSAGEIAGVAAKATPAGADLLLIEDSAAGNVKKRIRADSLPFQPPGSYLTTGAINTTVQGYSAALAAVSGTNTGDETQASIKTKLGAAGPGDGFLTAAQYVTLSNALQPTSTLDATKLSGTATVNTTGNAATATKLATPRTINGQNFDGSANITITATDSTARVAQTQTINGVAYGSGNITINAVDATPRLATTAQAADSAKLGTVTPTANALTLIGHTFSQMVTDLSSALNTAYHGLTILGSEVTTALGFTPENVANKSTNVTTDGASDTKYPSVKAVKTYVDASVISGGVSSATFAAYTSVDRMTANNPTYTGTLTSTATDGDHMVFCANSGDMTTTGWSTADAGKFCYNQATGKYRYWNGSTLSDWPGSGGTVTSITASSPLTGGTITGSGTIGIPAAAGSVSGYLTSTDWTTFNGKQAALVSGTNIKTVAGISLLGSGDIGTIPTSKGGTGATDFSFSGTVHKVASVGFTNPASNKCLEVDSSGHLQIAGTNAACGAGGPGNGTVNNSSNAYRLAGYAASGTTVSDSGITYATDGSNITTAQSATDPDALALRTSSGNGSGFVAFIAPSSSVSTPYGFQFPATAPAAGKTLVYGTPASGTVNGVTTSIVPVTWADPGITSVSFTPTGDIAATGGSYTSIISPILTVTKIQGVAVDNTAPTTNDVFQYNGTSWLHVTPATLKGTLSLAKGDVGLGNVENTALSTWSGSTNITTLGAATATSLAASGLIDGTAPTVLSTSTTYTLGTSYKTNYTFNNYATAGTAITYTLPTAAAGRTECVKNYTGKTGTLRVNTSAAGQYIDMDGTNSASGGYVISGGALGDGACFVGADSTHWVMYAGKGTWTLN